MKLISLRTESSRIVGWMLWRTSKGIGVLLKTPNVLPFSMLRLCLNLSGCSASLCMVFSNAVLDMDWLSFLVYYGYSKTLHNILKTA